ncbi:MAG TPA: VOC family protein [Blastocatellia bacterium]|jgi:catechol 2,3-dioxygenase-like lactoylglutathione lyase family enzyme
MMKALFMTAAPYAGDAMNLPVQDVDKAIPYYEKMFGFRVALKQDAPHKSVILARDNVQIGLAENGGDPTQEGCFFEVDNVEAAFAELKANGLEKEEAGFRIDRHGDAAWKVFFVVAPDGLCYCLGERQN